MSSLTAIPFKVYIPKYLPQVLEDMGKYETLRLATVETFGKSFPTLYFIGLGFGVAACFASWLVGDMEKFVDEHVAVIY